MGNCRYLYIEDGVEMNTIARFIGWSLASIVNVISDLLYMISRPLWMRFGLWVTSVQEGENNEEI